MKRIIIAIISVLLLSSFVLAKMTVSHEASDGVVYNVEINLYKGWNLIPAVCDTGIEKIQEANINTMFVLNPNTREYVNIYHDGEFRNEDKLSPIEEQVCSNSWWVHVSESNLFKYTPDRLPKLEDKQIYRGWNFLIITPEMANDDDARPSELFQANDFAGSCNIEKSFAFDPTEQQWVNFPVTEEFYQRVTGFGWAVKVSENCKMGFEEESVGAPPALPE